MFRKLIKSVFYFFLFSIVTNILISALKHVKFESGPYCSEFVLLDTLTNDKLHSRFWKLGTQPKRQCMTYETTYSHYNIAEEKRNSLKPPESDLSFENFWGTLYQQLVDQNSEYLTEVGDSLFKIANENDLDRNEFADLLVSFVQDIPYSYIQYESCDSTNTEGKNCVDKVAYGILSPIEFLYTLNGDCDTRTVLLYILLKRFNYMPLIMISKEYMHSMIAVDIKTTGHYITYGVNKHYFWETTGSGWPPGMIPTGMENLDYWKIALSYEL